MDAEDYSFDLVIAMSTKSAFFDLIMKLLEAEFDAWVLLGAIDA